jgi:hypothetical protein
VICANRKQADAPQKIVGIQTAPSTLQLEFALVREVEFREEGSSGVGYKVKVFMLW